MGFPLNDGEFQPVTVVYTCKKLAIPVMSKITKPGVIVQQYHIHFTKTLQNYQAIILRLIKSAGTSSGAHIEPLS